MNVVIVHSNQQAEFAPQHNLYAIEVDHGNRNCYNCGDSDIWLETIEIRKLEIELGKRGDWNIGTKTTDNKGLKD